MDTRSISLVVISIGFIGFVNVVLTNPLSNTPETSLELSQIFEDCQDSDYRTYIQCLRRYKRHHFMDSSEDSPCMQECIRSCVTTKRMSCFDGCKHCIHKSKTRVINITETEYETECISGNCTNVAKAEKNNTVTVNVTNHIHIHNHYVFPHTRQVEKHRPCPCYAITWLPCYCRPQIPLCQYTNQWPCVPYGGGIGSSGAIGSVAGGGIIGGGIGGIIAGGAAPGLMVGGTGPEFVGGGTGGIIGVDRENIVTGGCSCDDGTPNCNECQPQAG